MNTEDFLTLEPGAESSCPIRPISSTPKNTSGSRSDGKRATIGITNYAQESLGDIVFVELPKVGSEITAGKTFGTVESVKAVSDCMLRLRARSPKSTVSWPRLRRRVNKDAHGAWMLKITLKDPGELNSLLSAADYEKFVAEEGRTLRVGIADCVVRP